MIGYWVANFVQFSSCLMSFCAPYQNLDLIRTESAPRSSLQVHSLAWDSVREMCQTRTCRWEAHPQSLGGLHFGSSRSLDWAWFGLFLKMELNSWAIAPTIVLPTRFFDALLHWVADFTLSRKVVRGNGLADLVQWSPWACWMWQSFCKKSFIVKEQHWKSHCSLQR